MSKIVIFRDNPNTHDEEYLARATPTDFVSVEFPEESNLDFESAAEAYQFAEEFPELQFWRVGRR